MYHIARFADIHVGENGYLVIKNAQNRIIMHPERAQWGMDILAGRPELYKDAALDLDSLPWAVQSFLISEPPPVALISWQ